MVKRRFDDRIPEEDNQDTTIDIVNSSLVQKSLNINGGTIDADEIENPMLSPNEDSKG